MSDKEKKKYGESEPSAAPKEAAPAQEAAAAPSQEPSAPQEPSQDAAQPAQEPATLQWQAEEPAAAGGTEPVQPTPGSKKPLIIIAVAAVLILALVGVAVAIALGSGLFSNPEEAVRKAMTATSDTAVARSEKLAKEIPAYNLILDTTVKPERTDFDIRFTSLEGDFPTDVNMVAKLFSGIGVQGTLVADPASPAVETELNLAMEGNGLVGLYAFLSPDLVAANVPTFSDKLISLNPSSFIDDLKNSPYYEDLYMSEMELRQIQDMLKAEIDMLGALNQLDVKEMQSKMMEILENATANATFEKTGKDGSDNVYVVTIPGGDVKKCVLQLARYIYIDSPLGELYENMFSAMADLSWKELVEDEIISELDKNLPELETVATLKINKTVKSANVVVTPMGDDSVISGLVIDFAIAEDNSQTATVTCTSDFEVPTTFTMNVKDSYAGGEYKLDMDMLVEEDTGIGFKFTQTMAMDKEGAYKQDLVLGIEDSTGISMGLGGTYGLLLDGTIKQDGDKTAYDFPNVSAYAKNGYGTYTVNFNAKADVTPVQSPYQISRAHKSIFEMSEDELMEETEKYEAGAQKLAMQFYGMLFGGSGSSPFPKAPGGIPEGPAMPAA